MQARNYNFRKEASKGESIVVMGLLFWKVATQENTRGLQSLSNVVATYDHSFFPCRKKVQHSIHFGFFCIFFAFFFFTESRSLIRIQVPRFACAARYRRVNICSTSQTTPSPRSTEAKSWWLGESHGRSSSSRRPVVVAVPDVTFGSAPSPEPMAQERRRFVVVLGVRSVAGSDASAGVPPPPLA